MKIRKAILILITLFAALLFVDRPASWLFDPDETRYAEIPQSMLASGDFLTPKLNGSNYFEKPPLLYWLNVFSLRTFGDTPFAARLPARLATLATALLLLLALRSQASSTHLWGALIFLSAMLPFTIGRINLTDGIVSFGIALTLLSCRSFILARNQNRKGTWWLMAIGIGTAISVLSKGLIGIVLPGLILTLWVACTDQWLRWREILISRAALLFLLLSVPWFVLMELRHPAFYRIFFIREHLLRYVTDEANRTGSLLYFGPVFLLGMIPWTIFLLAALRSFSPVKLVSWRRQSDKLFFAIWLAVIFVFFSFSHSKLIPYLLPAFPAAAVLAGTFIAENQNNLNKPLWLTAIFWSVLAVGGVLIGEKSGILGRYELTRQAGFIAAVTVTACWLALFIHKRRGPESLLVLSSGWAVVYVILIGIVPKLATNYSLHDVAVKAGAQKSDLVVAYGTFPQSFPLVLKRPIPIVNYRGELASDEVLNPNLFWSTGKFSTIWNSTQTVVAVYRRDQNEYFMRQGKKPRVITENRKFILAANYESKK